jgi:hypothetical protein
VRVRYLETTREVLTQNGVAHAESELGIAVTPLSAGNTIIEFAE